MYPILVDLGVWQTRSYGVLVAVAILVGIWWSAREAERRGLARSMEAPAGAPAPSDT